MSEAFPPRADAPSDVAEALPLPVPPPRVRRDQDEGSDGDERDQAGFLGGAGGGRHPLSGSAVSITSMYAMQKGTRLAALDSADEDEDGGSRAGLAHAMQPRGGANAAHGPARPLSPGEYDPEDREGLGLEFDSDEDRPPDPRRPAPESPMARALREVPINASEAEVEIDHGFFGISADALRATRQPCPSDGAGSPDSDSDCRGTAAAASSRKRPRDSSREAAEIEEEEEEEEEEEAAEDAERRRPLSPFARRGSQPLPAGALRGECAVCYYATHSYEPASREINQIITMMIAYYTKAELRTLARIGSEAWDKTRAKFPDPGSYVSLLPETIITHVEEHEKSDLMHIQELLVSMRRNLKILESQAYVRNLQGEPVANVPTQKLVLENIKCILALQSKRDAKMSRKTRRG